MNNTSKALTTKTQPADHMDRHIAEIAKRILDIETLVPANRDRFDFHEKHVTILKAALEAAYKAGRASK